MKQAISSSHKQATSQHQTCKCNALPEMDSKCRFCTVQNKLASQGAPVTALAISQMVTTGENVKPTLLI